MNETKSQNAAILAHLQTGAKLTPLDSLRLYGSFRLSGRVYDLKAQGHNIKSGTFTTESGKRVAQYWIDPTDPFILREKKKKEKKIGFTRLREVAREVANGDLLTELAYSKLITAAERL